MIQPVYKTIGEVEAARQRTYRYFVDFIAGKKADNNIRRHWGCRSWFETS